MAYKAFATGTAYLKVKPYFSSSTNLSYELAYATAGGGDSMGLSNGVPRTVAAIAMQGYVDFVLPVPTGQTNLVITLSGGNGDADLYVARGYFPWSEWDYQSENAGNAETIAIPNPAAGEWFIEPYGYEASSNFTVCATYTPGAATIASAAHTLTNATFAIDLTNGARVTIYSATNLTGKRWNWVARSNNAVVVNGQVRVNVNSNWARQVLSVGRPPGF